ncbi:hypothetical protein DFA_06922 [Cavenderia fasciculata]|uniref:Ankyrin repeat-containing protein n=1 Tax=Cavenderia fasciculata TaxID=261658 RepID=F4PX17_CACFS|nr:uncharacterized protein DFA_06922 [Cavenderia fasciculata]EGG19820.1 hypothetical protein DFA_06922 [Cavenderia fasciculata]|eukprot:XP_004358166.1 hypothetical protein DFA_06922 [Cavenderia fasciculata]
MMDIELFKKIVISNHYLKDKIFQHVYSINRLTINSVIHSVDSMISIRRKIRLVRWNDIIGEPILMVRFGSLKELVGYLKGQEEKYSHFKWTDRQQGTDTYFVPNLSIYIDLAVEYQRMDIVDYLYKRYSTFQPETLLYIIRSSIKHNRFNIFQLFESIDPTYAIDLVGSEATHLIGQQFVEYLLDKQKTKVEDDHCQLPIKQWSIGTFTVDFIRLLCQSGYTDLLLADSILLEKAASKGNIELLRYLYETYPDRVTCTESAMETAVTGGSLETVIYLHSKGRGGEFIEHLLYIAILNHHLDVAEYILDNLPSRQRGQRVISGNTWYGGCNTFHWLVSHELISYPVSNDYILLAARNGDVGALKEILGSGQTISTDIIADIIAEMIPSSSGDYYNQDGCLYEAFYFAVSELDFNKTDTSYYERALYKAIFSNHMEIVKWIVESGLDNPTISYLSLAVQSNDLEMVKYIYTRDKGLNLLGHSSPLSFIKYSRGYPKTKQIIQYLVGQFKIDIQEVDPNDYLDITFRDVFYAIDSDNNVYDQTQALDKFIKLEESKHLEEEYNIYYIIPQVMEFYRVDIMRYIYYNMQFDHSDPSFNPNIKQDVALEINKMFNRTIF